MTKQYQIIYADPPWRYNNGGVPQAGVDKQYCTMAVSDICILPVKELSDKDSILFLWATFPQLAEALAVIKAWGFEYKTIAFTWIKMNPSNMGIFFGVGNYTKSNAEICLLATKGNAHKLVKDNSVSQIIMTPTAKHSRKPIECRE